MSFDESRSFGSVLVEAETATLAEVLASQAPGFLEPRSFTPSMEIGTNKPRIQNSIAMVNGTAQAFRSLATK
jgi:hypothetical protein